MVLILGEWAAVKAMRWAIKLVVMLLLAILLIMVYNYLKDPQHLPIHTVKVEGKLSYLSRDELKESLNPYLNKSFLTVDVKAMQAALQANPWVAHCNIFRIWPDTISVEIFEEEPIAYWQNDGLLGRGGKLIQPKQIPELQIPRLFGPDDQMPVVLSMLGTMNELLSPKQVQVALLQMNERRAWQATLSNGIQMQLGSKEVVPRLSRFVDSYPFKLNDEHAVRYIDLRYTNGFVVASDKP